MGQIDATIIYFITLSITKNEHTRRMWLTPPLNGQPLSSLIVILLVVAIFREQLHQCQGNFKAHSRHECFIAKIKNIWIVTTSPYSQFEVVHMRWINIFLYKDWWGVWTLCSIVPNHFHLNNFLVWVSCLVS